MRQTTHVASTRRGQFLETARRRGSIRAREDDGRLGIGEVLPARVRYRVGVGQCKYMRSAIGISCG